MSCWSGYGPKVELVEFPEFADASKLVYGAVVSLRIVVNQKVFVTLQVTKTRVAAFKTLSIPRLKHCVIVVSEISSLICYSYANRDKYYASMV